MDIRKRMMAERNNAVPVADQKQDVNVSSKKDISAANKIDKTSGFSKEQWRAFLIYETANQEDIINLLRFIKVKDLTGPLKQVDFQFRQGYSFHDIAISIFYAFEIEKREYQHQYGIAMANNKIDEALAYFAPLRRDGERIKNQVGMIKGSVENGSVKGEGTIAVSPKIKNSDDKSGVELIDISKLGLPKEKEEFVFEIRPQKAHRRNPNIDLMKKAYEELPFATARFYSDKLLGEHAGLSATEIQSKYKYSLAEYNAIVKELENYNN